MDNVVVSVRGLSKMYKLYRQGHHRLLDFFGLRFGEARRYFKEHWALCDVTFDIARGSTVGIIGRNGAGKSTLLRLLAGTIAPTCGEIVLNGRVSALLELGTGFHPDLTGHENIYASGLYLGLDRRAMEALYEHIVAFAELGEFLHQPVRTYSAGMYMRLAFSVATSVPADIQVIDEVLGVGDAYFFGKCLQRFREIRESGRTTILVSHDHGTVLRVCSRCLWIEQGRIVADGAPLEVITAYLHSIYEERDRHAGSGRSAPGAVQMASPTLRATRAVHIEEVEFRNEAGVSAHHFAMGETLIIRIHYDSRVTLTDAVVSATVYRADGVTVCNAISSMDGVLLDVIQGRGAIDVVFDRLALGPGEYTVAVGIYPSLDLSDPAGVQHAVLWHRPRTFSVRHQVGVAVDLGVIRHPVRWRLTNSPSVALSAAPPTMCSE